MNRKSSKKNTVFHQMFWLPLVRLWMFSLSIFRYIYDNQVIRTFMSVVVSLLSSVIVVSAFFISHYLFLFFILIIPISIGLAHLYMIMTYGVEGARADLRQIKEDFHDRMWRYENQISGDERDSRYLHMVYENEPDNLSYRIAGYMVALGGGVDSDCVKQLNSIVASGNKSKSAIYVQRFYEGLGNNYNLQNDINMYVMKTSEDHEQRLKFIDMLVALSFIDNNIQVDKFKFIREMSERVEVNDKELNRILNTRTNGQYGVRYGINDMTQEEKKKADYELEYGTVETFALTLMGYVASADRNVSSEEYDLFISMIEDMQEKIAQNKEDEYVKRFHRGTSPKYNPRQDIQLFRKKYGNQLIKYRELLSLLIKMAYADEEVSRAEYDRILRIAELLELKEEAVQSILYDQTGGRFGRKPQLKQLSSDFYR